ncbi:MAG TPA: DUF167 family protein [Candidatus Sulfomarinibacteraceae bacterium]|nr:DUF167 family protein [Candidatus Sulfomarinibacteraceae bacterium]
MTPSDVRELRIPVRATPRAGRDSIDGVRDGCLLVRVAAAPADGAANEAVLRLVAAEAGVPRRAVRLVAGAAGRRKLVAVDGADRAALVARWPDLGV